MPAIKSILLLVISFFCLIAMLVSLQARSSPTTSQAADPVSTNDPGTEAVAAFYRALLQDGQPTLEQERSIFADDPSIRKYLEIQNKEPDKDPVILQFFRAQKNSFIPVNMKGPRQIQISSTFDFPRNADRVKIGQRAFQWVIAIFPNNVNGRPIGWNELVFIVDNGKLQADGIYFGGFGGVLSGERFFGE